MSWKDLLAGATVQRTLERAESCVGKGTRYKLGKGGFDPTAAFTPQCDCSGFIAWCMGVPRELPPGSDRWLDTDGIWQGGGSVGNGLFTRITDVGQAQPGDLYVYPDSNGHQGHVSIISEVGGGHPTRITHCSLGNDNNFGDAVRETAPDVFTSGNHPTRIMHIEFDVLRHLFGVEPAERTPRLILAKLQHGAEGDSFEYKFFPDARFVGGHFEIAPSIVAPWLGKTSDNTAATPIRTVLDGLQVPYKVNLEHLGDEDDPRAYVFVLA